MEGMMVLFFYPSSLFLQVHPTSNVTAVTRERMESWTSDWPHCYQQILWTACECVWKWSWNWRFLQTAAAVCSVAIYSTHNLVNCRNLLVGVWSIWKSKAQVMQFLLMMSISSKKSSILTNNYPTCMVMHSMIVPAGWASRWLSFSPIHTTLKVNIGLCTIQCWSISFSLPIPHCVSFGCCSLHTWYQQNWLPGVQVCN